MKRKIKRRFKVKFWALLPLLPLLSFSLITALIFFWQEAPVQAVEQSMGRALRTEQSLNLRTIPEGNPASEEDAGSVRLKPLIEDEVGLLSDAEYDRLLKQLETISKRHKCDVAVVTVYSLNGLTAEEFADDYFDYNGYGYGQDDDGILFLLSMEYRDWAMTTHQFGIYAFDDYGLDQIFSELKADLAADQYYSAFSRFAEECDYFLERARAGKPVRIHDEKRKKARVMGMSLAGLGFGSIGGIAPVNRMRKELKTVHRVYGASHYMNRKSRRLDQAADKLIDRRTRVYPIAQASNSASSSTSGTSSTHRSSSGRSHGGRSGKF
ncbi:MAG: TPM domain-containing protein [Eubacteriales bacterium]|nr:TPM domain-containing protein [Eubacteriales bacterium]